jgi:hypothetical protein
MSIILSCLHEVENTYDGHTIITKNYDRKSRRAISYMSVCTKCKLQYVTDDAIFANEDEAINWMFGE